jgi:hypothetical protein
MALSPDEEVALAVLKAERDETDARRWCEVQEGTRLSNKEQSVLWREVSLLAGEMKTALANAYDCAGLAESYDREMMRCARHADAFGENNNPHTAVVLYSWAWDAYLDRERMYRDCDRYLCESQHLTYAVLARLNQLREAVTG